MRVSIHVLNFVDVERGNCRDVRWYHNCRIRHLIHLISFSLSLPHPLLSFIYIYIYVLGRVDDRIKRYHSLDLPSVFSISSHFNNVAVHSTNFGVFG